jgi:hypothetical protein
MFDCPIRCANSRLIKKHDCFRPDVWQNAESRQDFRPIGKKDQVCRRRCAVVICLCGGDFWTSWGDFFSTLCLAMGWLPVKRGAKCLTLVPELLNIVEYCWYFLCDPQRPGSQKFGWVYRVSIKIWGTISGIVNGLEVLSVIPFDFDFSIFQLQCANISSPIDAQNWVTKSAGTLVIFVTI